MIPMEQALAISRRKRSALVGAEETVELSQVVGRSLAEVIRSDIDLPPFHRVAMDGYAIQSSDVSLVPVDLKVNGTVFAGEVATNRVKTGTAVRIMTGAPLPLGADAVVMVEATDELNSGRAVRINRGVAKGDNVCTKGEDLKKGARVLSVGRRLGPADTGILATVGRAEVRVFRRPRVAILSTGDELVEPGAAISEGKIRNSNAWMLADLVRCAGGEPRLLRIARDKPRQLAARIRDGLQDEVFLLSGGVSMGIADHVPRLLAEAGVEAHFHRVAIKPAKPIFFGTHGDATVFGLPGNPISSCVGFLVFVVPLIRCLLGQKKPELAPDVRLGGAVTSPKGLTEFRPVRLQDGRAHPVPYNGSGHLASLLEADGFAVLCRGRAKFRLGERVGFLPLPRSPWS